jgi:sRNA-binding protein
MTYRKQYKELKRAPSPPTRYTTTLGDLVWVKVGGGWCAAKVIETKRDSARVHFLTGAKEERPYGDLRWRRDDIPPKGE